jgi:hypothetical protein
VIRELEHLAADGEDVVLLERDRGQGPLRIRGALQ